jgi:predicted DNA-binding transcriptional regulator AlpA
MARRIRPFTEPRILTGDEAAAYLGRSKTWWTDNVDTLYRAGFPKPLPIVGGYDKDEIDSWLDSLHEQNKRDRFSDAWMRAVSG